MIIIKNNESYGWVKKFYIVIISVIEFLILMHVKKLINFLVANYFIIFTQSLIIIINDKSINHNLRWHESLIWSKKIFLYQAISFIPWVLCLMIYFNRYFILEVSLFCIRIFSGALLKFGESLMAWSKKRFFEIQKYHWI